MNNNKKVREPLFHIAKRTHIPMSAAMGIRILSIIAALVFCGLLVSLVLNENPFDFYYALIDGNLGSERRIWKLAKEMAVLLCISLAVTPAFRMKFWNIGAEGQVLVGALASVACMYYLGGKISEPVLLLVMFVASAAASCIWTLIPALFKVKWNTNETLFTLMMNYIATYLVSYFLIKWTPNGSSSLGILPNGHLPVINDNKYIILIIAVLILTVSLYIYLNFSKHGYEISVVGESENTAKYIGINVKKVVVRTMLLSGFIAGIAGYLLVAALDHSVTTETVGGMGFTAIMVSWLAKFDPITMLGSSFLITFLDQGAAQVSQNFNISGDFPDVVVGIILFFIIGCEFFINYKIVPCKKTNKSIKKKEEGIK